MYILKSATRIVLILLILSIIVLNFLWIEVQEPLKTVVLMVVSFYFWNKMSSVSKEPIDPNKQ